MAHGILRARVSAPSRHWNPSSRMASQTKT
jgi:hypothetical protein